MMEIIERLVDNSEFEAYKDGYGQTILTGYARIDGWAVGIVANQRKVVKTKKGEMQLEGSFILILPIRPLVLSPTEPKENTTSFSTRCNRIYGG